MPPKQEKPSVPSQPDPVAEAAETHILDAVGAFFADPAINGAMTAMKLLQDGSWPIDTRGMADDLVSRYINSRAARELGDLSATIKAADKAKREAAIARKNREAAEKNEAAAAAKKAEADEADAAAKEKAEAAKKAEREAAARLGKATR